jgi:homoserine O-succinyltransferase
MLTVALVNNMPDSAFVDTEEQFRAAVGSGSEADPVELELYTITELPREAAVAAHIRNAYSGLGELWERPPDAIVITGTEPVQAQLAYEPYWPYLARLLEWTSTAVPSALLSCLAAHASVLLFDGIERVPRREKCSGVFPQPVTAPDDPLAAGLPPVVPVPHSRVNDIPTAALVKAGYRLVIDDTEDDIGWSVATRTCGISELVLCQGHPEYSTHSLLREYRRDVRRSLFGRGAVPYPQPPTGYIGPDGLATLRAFEQRAAAADAEPRELFAQFPYDEVAAGIENTWTPWATTLYGNWLAQVRAGHRAGA